MNDLIENVVRRLSTYSSVTILGSKAVSGRIWLVRYRPIDHECVYWMVLEIEAGITGPKRFIYEVVDITPDPLRKYVLHEMKMMTAGHRLVKIDEFPSFDLALEARNKILDQQGFDQRDIHYYHFNGGINNMMQLKKEGKVQTFAITLDDQSAHGVVYDPEMEC